MNAKDGKVQHMYLGRNLSELNDILMKEWDMKELVYHHRVMSDMADFLNQQGVSIHHKIIDEIKIRGGIPKD